MKLKNRSNFLDKCLILHCLIKIKGKYHVWSRDKSIAKYFQKDKSQFSTFDKLFILVFVTNYPISWKLLMDIIFGYPGKLVNLILSDKPKIFTFYHMLGILLLYNNFYKWPCQAIHTNHLEVECCTVALILSS